MRAKVLLGVGAATLLAAGVYLGRSSTSAAQVSAPSPVAATAPPPRARVSMPTPAPHRAKATPALAADLTDANPRVRATALRDAAKDPDADPAILLAASRDPDVNVAMIATDLLGKRYAEGAVPMQEMLDRARDRGLHARVRTGALNGLGVVAAPEAAALLSDLLAHGDLLERRSAAILLVHQDPEVAVPALISALGDADEVVRANALDALRTRSRGRDFGRDAAAWQAWWQSRPR
jgi:hypothetical protein